MYRLIYKTDYYYHVYDGDIKTDYTVRKVTVEGRGGAYVWHLSRIDKYEYIIKRIGRFNATKKDLEKAVNEYFMEKKYA